MALTFRVVCVAHISCVRINISSNTVLRIRLRFSVVVGELGLGPWRSDMVELVGTQYDGGAN